MKSMSKVVALILSASAGVWLAGCAAEMGDPSEETDSALANVEKGGGISTDVPSTISKGGSRTAPGGQFGGGQVTDEKIEDGQRLGGDGQAADLNLGQDTGAEDTGAADDVAGQDAADDEGDTSESQEALNSWWGPAFRPYYGGFGYGWRGYGVYPGRRFFYGGYGAPYLPYYYGGGCGGAYLGGCYW